jgi:hypothetical protein
MHLRVYDPLCQVKGKTDTANQEHKDITEKT